MKLSDKGRQAPPPRLASRAAQRVADTVAAWPGVNARTHWQLGNEQVVDGADFYLDQDEIGHLHLDAEAHVALPTPLVDALLRAGLAERFPWGRNFVVFQLDDSAGGPHGDSIEHALWLFQLSYDRRAGTPASELLARVQERAAASTRSA